MQERIWARSDEASWEDLLTRRPGYSKKLAQGEQSMERPAFFREGDTQGESNQNRFLGG